MRRTLACRALARAGVLAAALALAPSAFAHAELFPNVIPSGDGYLLNLAVPNEKENASTTEIELTIPSGFDLEHVAPVQGWTATVSGQHEENGEKEGGDSVTWKGKLSGTGLAVLPFTGVPKNNGEYAFTVRQTYSDGSVVEWSGSESSDAPAARITATSDTSSGGGSDSSKTIAIIALVVGALGLVVGGAGLLSGRRAA
jgi:periplasmic copper chaperone A